jgi:hypothetical protein
VVREIWGKKFTVIAILRVLVDADEFEPLYTRESENEPCDDKLCS